MIGIGLGLTQAAVLGRVGAPVFAASLSGSTVTVTLPAAGRVYGVIKAAGTPMLASAIIAGSGATLAFNFAAASGTTNQVIDISTLPAGSWYLHLAVDYTGSTDVVAPIGFTYSPPSTSALFQSVNAAGWSATYASPPTFAPDVTPESFTVTRAGFDASGAAITFAENLVCTKRIRQVYPNHASLTADQVALSDYVYAADTVAGAVNNSTIVSPKPIVDWALPDRQLVGNTLHLELVAFHRDARGGESAACVEFSATDGTTTVTAKVSASAILGHPKDRVPVIGYQADLDLSTLADNATITVNAKVYPKIGVSASIADSSANSGQRHFAPRKYYRSTARAAAPLYIYVAPGGNNATAVLSATPATAEATPALTIEGALVRAHTLNGNLNGVIIRVKAGTYTLSNTGLTGTLTLADGAEVIVERDPNAARSAVIVQLPAVTFQPKLGSAGGQLRWRDLTFNRTAAASGFTGEVASFLRVVFDTVAFGNGSYSFTLFYSDSAGWWLGTDITNGATSFWTAGLRDHLAWRGCSGATVGPEGHLMLGNAFSGMAGASYGSKSPSGAIIAFNNFTQATQLITINPTSGGQIAIVQNVVEITNAAAVTAIQIVGVTALDHVCIWHNTITGFFTVGRSNLFYDEAPGCTTSLTSTRGNIHNQLNEKNDVFATNASYANNFAFEHGAGCYGEFSQFIDATAGGIGGSFAQDYPGLNANIGTSSTVRNDPLFVDYEGVTSGPTGGAGNGNYALQAGSPAKARLKVPCLKWDAAGASRSLTAASAGAYE